MLSCAGRWAFIIPLVFVTAPTRGASFCSDILARAGLQRRARVLENILAPIPIAPTRTGFWRDWSLAREERKLLRKMDPTLLASARYREWLVNQLVELRMRADRSPLADFEATPFERRALARLLLRSVLDHGLTEWSRENSPPETIAAIARVIGEIRKQPALRLFTEWRLPESTFKLNDRQLTLFFEHGLSGLVADPEFAALNAGAKNSERFRIISKYGRRLLFAGLVLWPTVATFHHLTHPPEQAYAQARQRFVDETQPTLHPFGARNSEDLLLSVAKGQMHAILVEFQKKNGAPTAAQRAEIANYVCIQQFADALSSNGVAKCLLLPFD